MFGYYTPVLLLQAFCLYNVYTRKDDQKWFFIIFFVPILGCLFYLYQTFYSSRNVKFVAEGVKSTLNSNYKIDQLEKDLSFSDTVANRITLAEAYIDKGDYTKAHTLLEECLHGIHKDDIHLLMTLVNAYYLNGNYDKAITYGQQIVSETEFKNSKEKVALAWSYHYNGSPKKATELFDEMDMRYSNYNLRLEYAKYLETNENIDLAIKKLEIMLNEIDTLNSYEKKLNRTVFREIRSYYQQLVKKQ
ncbi:tetratricopeptide repeat protein [Wenyingzhuangia sp. IMCC45574]